MINNDMILSTIFDALDTVNEHLPGNQQIDKQLDTVLLGNTGKIDSMTFVQILVATEQRFEEELDVSISLTDEKAMSERSSPFRTVRTLADYIAKLLATNGNG